MPLKSKLLYEFGAFRFDPAERLLTSEGTPIPLAPKAFDVLLLLVQNGSRLTTKEELMRRVWPDSFVEEANLTVNISALRKVLGTGPGGQHYIETVPKNGYRFVMPIRELRDSDLLVPAARVGAMLSDSNMAGPKLVESTSSADVALPAAGPARAPTASARLPYWVGSVVLVVIAVGVSRWPDRQRMNCEVWLFCRFRT